MAYLFGYYAKDQNYKDCARAVVEILYIPPQFGDRTSIIPQPDQDVFLIDRITKDLILECVGLIFTTLKEENVALTSYNTGMRIVIFIFKYNINHPKNYFFQNYRIVNYCPL